MILEMIRDPFCAIPPESRGIQSENSFCIADGWIRGCAYRGFEPRHELRTTDTLLLLLASRQQTIKFIQDCEEG